jgi:two-component system, OmpR family, sensor kinase
VRRLPVRWRLTLAFAFVMAVVLAATGLFVYQRQEANLDGAINRALGARADDVAALAQQSDSGLREARPGANGRRAELAQLIAPTGRVLDRTPGVPRRSLLSSAQLTSASRGQPVTSEVTIAGDEPVRLLAQPVRAQDQTLVVVVGQSLEDRNTALEDLTGVLSVGGPGALVLASLAGYLLTGAALRPVEAMRRRAEAISAADLDQRLPPAGNNDELGRLGRTINDMLARIEASVDRERTFFSDASHELRSPLAMLRTELELIARERPTGSALQSATGSAIEETDRLSRLADDLLLLARADDHQLALRRGSAPAAELLHQARDRATRRAAAAGIQITVDAAPSEDVDVDRGRIAQALDNLLANALRYASSHVALFARPNGAFLELHVTDDGPGFPPDFLPYAWERFARADAARTEDGVGLGLARTRHRPHYRRNPRRPGTSREPRERRRRRLDHAAPSRRSGGLCLYRELSPGFGAISLAAGGAGSRSADPGTAARCWTRRGRR